MRKVKKRYILLLEVLIAFTLIVLCALPLIYPHSYILTVQREFIKEIELDHEVNKHYADLLLELYKNNISWKEIISGDPIEVNTELPYTGTVQFRKLQHKPDKKDEPVAYNVYLFEIKYIFTSKQSTRKPLEYVYNLMIIRDVPPPPQTSELEFTEIKLEDPR